MNSKVNIKKLGKDSAHTNRVRQNLLNDLIVYEHLQTTTTKAKVLIKLFDQVVTAAKNSAPEYAEVKLRAYGLSANATKKLIEVLKPRFEKQPNGFAAIYKIGNRKGDNAPMIQIFVKGYEYKDLGKKKTVKKKTEAKKEEAPRQSKITAEKNLQRASQAAVSSTQGKAKSRSGV